MPKATERTIPKRQKTQRQQHIKSDDKLEVCEDSGPRDSEGRSREGGGQGRGSGRQAGKEGCGKGGNYQIESREQLGSVRYSGKL
ncbi:hypothetical protein FRC12_003677 [Ceratobasidium sp. 428]|nr:hypothetical protein FRC12_003677 [Ceratobasidium sp. 428]